MTGGHLDADTLAAYQEHLLHRDQAAHVASHLAGCPQCAGILGQLTEVTARLAAAPPPAIPPSVAALLDAALAGEAQRGLSPLTGHTSGAAASTPAVGTAPGASSGHPGVPPRHGRFSRTGRRRIAIRVASIAAAAVVVAGGIYGLTRLAGSSSSASSASSAAVPAARRPLSGGSAGNAARKSAAGIPSLPLMASGTDYRPGRLRAEVRTALRRYASEHANGTLAPSVPRSVSRSFPHLDACVSRVTAGHAPELVDLARYEGSPAAVIVLRAHTGRRVWIVGTGCSGGVSDVISKFDVP